MPTEERFRKGHESIGYFAKFPTMEAGLRAMASQLLLDYKRGHNTVGDEIMKYAPPADKNNTKKYISSVAGDIGVSADTPLNLTDPETLVRMMEAMLKVEQGRGIATHEQLRGIVDARLAENKGGPRAPQIHHETNITVEASNDPNATARAVGREQTNVYGTAYRNMGPVLQ